MTHVLLVDDEKRTRELLGAELEGAGFAVTTAADGEEAWQRFCRKGPGVVLTDMSMPRCDGIELLRRIRSRSDVPVIVFSGSASVEIAARAFKAGADDFVGALDAGTDELVRLVGEAARSGQTPPSDADLEHRLAGESEVISRIRWQLNGLAPLFAPVLVSGESGTGRATAIRALHDLGATGAGTLHRMDARRFVPADFPQSGAIGAVHLEDVEHLSADAQAYWARRLERDEQSSLARSFRIFASTSSPLRKRVEAGAFHPRLGRALLRFEVEMPPLRVRPQDVPPIAVALLEKIREGVGRARVQLSPASLEYLASCRFSDNLHQLERLLERAVAYTRGRVIRRQTLRDLMADLEKTIAAMREERSLLERQRLLDALHETGGNITRTAALLEKSRAAVYRLIAKHDIPLAPRG